MARRGMGKAGGFWGGLVIWAVASPLFALDLNGTGVRGAQGLLAACQKAYATLSPEPRVKYDPQDSRQGTAQWLGKGADFLVVDFPLIPSDEKQAAGNLLYIPVGLSAAVVTYNLPGVPSGLRLTPQMLLDIFSGKITRWNNSNLRELNPGLPLPDLAIRVFHRDDESSLFDLFPRYLQKLDDQWPMDDPGPDQKVKWPVGEGVSGGGELLKRLRETAGSLGVMDYLDAASRQLPAAELRNEVGVFTAPSAESLTAAVADFSDLPQDLKVSVDHARDPGAYPLTSFNWVLVRPRVPKGSRDFKKNQALAKFLGWWLSDGQTVEGEADGVPLPERFLDQARAQVAAIEVGDPVPTGTPAPAGN